MNALQGFDPRLVQALWQFDRSGIGVAQLPAFDWQEQVAPQYTRADMITLPGNVLLRVKVPAPFFYRRLYFAILLDDFSVYALTGELQFSIDSRIVNRWAIEKQMLPEAATLVTYPKFQFPATTRKVTLSNTDAVDMVETPAAPNAMHLHFRSHQPDSAPDYIYAVTVPPMQLTLACDTIEFKLTGFSGTTIQDYGNVKLALGCYSQNFPL
jgi:hypothetical protein